MPSAHKNGFRVSSGRCCSPRKMLEKLMFNHTVRTMRDIDSGKYYIVLHKGLRFSNGNAYDSIQFRSLVDSKGF
jgi:hypothetical protein